MKTLTLFLCAVLVGVYAIVPDEQLIELGLIRGGGFASRLTYMLAHGSWVHLLVNIYSLLVLVFLSNAKWWQGLVAFAVAVLMPGIILSESVSIIGISTYIYCLTGIVIIDSNKWFPLFAINTIIIVIGYVFFADRIAIIPHEWCFLVGAAVGFFTTKKLKRND